MSLGLPKPWNVCRAWRCTKKPRTADEDGRQRDKDLRWCGLHMPSEARERKLNAIRAREIALFQKCAVDRKLNNGRPKKMCSGRCFIFGGACKSTRIEMSTTRCTAVPGTVCMPWWNATIRKKCKGFVGKSTKEASPRRKRMMVTEGLGAFPWLADEELFVDG